MSRFPRQPVRLDPGAARGGVPGRGDGPASSHRPANTSIAIPSWPGGSARSSRRWGWWRRSSPARARPASACPVGRAGRAIPAQGLERLVDYRIIREVGRGGMGIVYEGRAGIAAPSRGAEGPGAAGDEGRRHAGGTVPRRERGSAARGVHHTNIVPIFEVGQAGEVLYYARCSSSRARASSTGSSTSCGGSASRRRRIAPIRPARSRGCCGPGGSRGASEAGMVAASRGRGRSSPAGECACGCGRARSVAPQGRRPPGRGAGRAGRDPAGGVGGIVGRAAGRAAGLGRRVEHESPAPLCP